MFALRIPRSSRLATAASWLSSTFRVATDGKGEHEAFQEAMDAFGSDLSIRLSRREPTPVASAVRGNHRRSVRSPLWPAPKLALHLSMRDRQIANSELARRLGVHERVVRRMLDPQHATKRRRSRGSRSLGGKQMIQDAA